MNKYLNHCWSCGAQIASSTSTRCRICGWYVCRVCGSCAKDCSHYDAEGYDTNYFNRNGIHKNGTRYDNYGFDIRGYDKDGYNRQGFDIKGYDRDGYNQDGFNSTGRDRDGYNRYGLDADGYNRQGYNKKGFNKKGVHKNGTLYDDNGFNADGVDVILLQCKKYTVGTKIIHNGLIGEIFEYIPPKNDPLIKIKYENNEIKMFNLKTLIIKGLINIYQK